jgi:hypothetical protein
MTFGANTFKELGETLANIEAQVQKEHDLAIENELASHSSLYSEVLSLIDTAARAAERAENVLAEAEQDAEDESSLAPFLP